MLSLWLLMMSAYLHLTSPGINSSPFVWKANEFCRGEEKRKKKRQLLGITFRTDTLFSLSPMTLRKYLSFTLHMGWFLGANIFHFKNSPRNCCVKIVLPLQSQQEAMPLGGSPFPHQYSCSKWRVAFVNGEKTKKCHSCTLGPSLHLLRHQDPGTRMISYAEMKRTDLSFVSYHVQHSDPTNRLHMVIKASVFWNHNLVLHKHQWFKTHPPAGQQENVQQGWF